MSMVKKAFRLKTKEDFERVFRKGKPLFFGAIACKVAPNSFGHFRIGFSFGKKHVATAVARNRMRRLISESFSQGWRAPSLPGAYDIAFFSVKKVSREQLVDFASVGQSVVKYIYKQ